MAWWALLGFAQARKTMFLSFFLGGFSRCCHVFPKNGVKICANEIWDSLPPISLSETRVFNRVLGKAMVDKPLVRPYFWWPKTTGWSLGGFEGLGGGRMLTLRTRVMVHKTPS